MADTFYRLARWVNTPFQYRIFDRENLSSERPKLFISNHAGSLGPISIFLNLPERFHPWVIAEMTDKVRTTDYLYRDFIKPAWHLKGSFGRKVAGLLAPIAVSVIKSFSPISVDRNRGWTREAFLESHKLLLAGQNLLIFPEDPNRDVVNQTAIRPFLGGFCWLSRMYLKSTGKLLVIQPMAVYPPKKSILIGKPVTLEITSDYRGSIALETKRLQLIVVDLYEQIRGR